MSLASTETVGDDDQGVRLDRWLRRRNPEWPQSYIQKSLRTGYILVDGKRAKANHRLLVGQLIKLPPETRPHSSPVRSDSQQDQAALMAMLVYEDRDLWGFNKPCGLAVQGGSTIRRSMDGMLRSFTGRDGDQLDRHRLVHRLDRATSGILMVARNVFAAAAMAKVFRNRQVDKVYWALVHGHPPKDSGVFTQSLAAHSRLHGRIRVIEAQEDGRPARTAYRRLGYWQDYTWLELTPTSGRMHQLRVHCAGAKMPICGDEKYASKPSRLPPAGCPSRRLYLHALSLQCPHPRGGIVRVKAPIPDHMDCAWKLAGMDKHGKSQQP